jgi:hypothetical protein
MGIERAQLVTVPVMDARFAAVDARFAAVDARFTQLEAKMDSGFASVNVRIDSLAASINVRFAETDLKMRSRCMCLFLRPAWQNHCSVVSGSGGIPGAMKCNFVETVEHLVLRVNMIYREVGIDHNVADDEPIAVKVS